jgi:hypothetical protein
MKNINHTGSCKKAHPKMSHDDWVEDQETVLLSGGENEEEELEELVDYDGSIKGGKVPLGIYTNVTISGSKTLDATVPMSRQGGGVNGTSRMGLMKRYWGESVEEIGEHNMEDVLGYEETQSMDAGETIQYFKKEHNMEKDEAEERAESMGKTIDLDKKGEDSSNYQRLVEDDDIIKMLEIILNKKDEDLQVQVDLTGEDSMLDRKINHLKKYARNKGYTVDDIIKLLKDE